MRFMAPHRRGMTIALLVFGLSASLLAQAQEAAYPNRPIKVMMGQSPGGAPDILMRLLSDYVGKTLGQPVILEYKPSAGGVIAQDAVAKAPADGYTWLFATPNMVAVTPYLKKKLPFDPHKDFMPITLIGESANVVVVGPTLKVKTAAEFVRHIKANPGTVTYASAGIGSPAHLAGELIESLTQSSMMHVPYKGASQALNDVVAGTVDFMITSPAAAKTFLQGGRLTALATTGARPDPVLPHLPMLSDTVPGYELKQWWGIILRSGTPEPIAQKVHAAFVEALNDPRIKERLQAQGVIPITTSMAAFGTFIKAERTRYQDLIKRANIPLED